MKSIILYRAFWLCNLIIYALLGVAAIAQDESVTTRPVSVQGQASLPNYTPPGALVVLVGGVEGTLYGSADSELDGSFIVEAKVPEGIARVLVHAVDPTNPEAFASASVALNPSAVLAANSLEGVRRQTGTDALTDVSVNAQSMAEVMVLSASGGLDRSVDALSLEDKAAVSRIAPKLDSTTQRMCSEGPSAEVGGPLRDIIIERRTSPPAVRAEFDKFVAQPGSLLERLRAGQQHINSSIKSWDEHLGARNILFKGLGAIYDRQVLTFSSPALSWFGFKKKEVSRDQLEWMANHIMSTDVTGCREKGLAVAYLATRFPEFKQVIVVAVKSGKFRNDHVVAIACTEDKSVYNVDDYAGSDEVDIPPKMLEAGCYVMDPWDYKTELFTQKYVKAQLWKWKTRKRLLVVDPPKGTPKQRMMQASDISEADVSEAEVPVCTGPGSLLELCAPFNDPIEVSHFNRFRIDFNTVNPVEINGVAVDPDKRPTSLLDWGHTGSFEGDTYRLQWSKVGVGNVELTFDIYARLNARHTVIYDLAYEQSEDDLDSNSVYFLERKFVATDIPLVPLAAQPSNRLKFMLKEPEQQVCERIFEYSDFQRKNVNYERREDLGSCDGSRQLSIEFYGRR